jgi:outer membrane protein OmpA-like peptidoglycan-associated protein/tetratricopeptide (TPR) repeat protein
MKFEKKLIFLLIILSLFTAVKAQVAKGDQYFKNLEYHNAISAYLKALKKQKKANDPELLAKIGDAFRLTKDYSNAATYYRLAIDKGSTNPDVFLHDGMILKSTGNYEEAEIKFRKCLELRPGNLLAMNGIRSCENVKKWKAKPKEYEATNLSKINTQASEFSPVIWKNKIVFVAERESDLINFSHYEFNDKPFLNVFSAEMKNDEPGKISEFAKKLNTIYHDGPVCFSKDGNTIYYTRVTYKVDKKNKEFVNRAKIYSSELNGTSLKKEILLPINDENFSVAHPSISDDGQFLFYCSDKPGGFGGFDIYCSKLGANGWEPPVNLGPDINTTGNEEFPFIRSDGVLFFSSDGLPGFGGFDIFSATRINGKWIMRRNEGTGLNDITDDFGVYFTNEKEGYFSSDRPGGLGSDDIYKFKYSSKSVAVDGFVLNSIDTANPAINQKIFLMDKEGNKIAETKTDNKGYFKFDNLEPEKNYMVKMDEQDPGFSDYPRYYYADNNGAILRATKKDQYGKFVFRSLPANENSMTDLESDDDFTIAGNVLFGDNSTQPVANAKLVLKDEKGHKVDETTTNAFGSFAFRKLPAGANYLIEMTDSDTPLPPNTRITITSKNGKEVVVIKTDEKGRFQFKILEQDKNFISEMNVDDKDLVMDISGFALNPEQKAIPGSKVFLLDEKGNKIAETSTGKDGAFVFKNLSSTKNYMISFDTDDPSLSSFDKVYVADKKGKIIKELKRLNQFKYKILAADKTQLGELFIDDPWLEVLELKNQTQKKEDITIVENVYYARGDWHFDASGQKIMDKVIKIMKDNPNLVIELSAHTDSKADDDFNLKLSEKRAKGAVEYIIKGGVNKSRVTAKGYGETKLINNCGNGVECPEEQHAQNRRTEFKIADKKK